MLMHDGASLTFRDAIVRHRGEASEVTERFAKLSQADQQAMSSSEISVREKRCAAGADGSRPGQCCRSPAPVVPFDGGVVQVEKHASRVPGQQDSSMSTDPTPRQLQVTPTLLTQNCICGSSIG